MKNKINKRVLAAVAVFGLAAMSTNVTMGLLASIMQTYSDVSPVTVQSVLVGPALVGMIYAFFFGKLNKKFTVKKLLIFAQCALLLYGIIFHMGGKVSIYALIVASGLAGFNMGSMNTVLGILMAGAVQDDKRRGSILGIMSALMNVGGVILTTLGGIIAARSTWQNAYWMFAYYILAIALEMILLPNVEPEGKAAPDQAGGAQAQEDKGGMGKVWMLSIHYFFFFLWLYVFGTNCSEFIVNTYKIGDAAAAGVAASCVTVGGIFAGLLYGFYSKILGKFTVPVLMGLSVVGLAIPVFVHNSVIGIYAAGILCGFAMMGANPYIMQYLLKIAPGPKYGSAMSIFAGFMNAGMVVAIYVIAFLTGLFFGDGAYVPGKFIVATVGDLIVFITSFFIYSFGKKSES